MRAPILTLLALAIVVICTSIASAQTPPDDSGQYHLITVTATPPTPACVQLQQSLAHPAVARIAAACKRFDFTPQHEIYLARYASALPPSQLPIVALVRGDGGVLYKASGTNIPGPESLAESLTKMATLDQSQGVRQSYQPSPSYGPLRPDGGWFPNRPNLIPDTVVVSPQINMPASFGVWLAIGAGCIFLFFVAAIAAGIYLFTRE